MKPEVFLKNIDLVSEASNGIDSLRKYILFLAVQGRLFQHDVDKSTGYPPGWKTLALDEIGDWGSGSTPLRGNSEYYGGDIPWFKSGELNEGTIFYSEEKITKKALAECSLRMNKVGDVLIAMYGATVGKTAIMGVEGTTNQAVCACTCNKLINNKYLLLLLKGFKDKFISMGAGAAQPNISKMKIVSTVVPVPPYAEQKRIVAKVDQLMILCDELEAKQEKQTQTRQQLNDVTLNALLSATSPKEFEKHWQRIVDNFDLLYDDLENLQFLRQGILQLAVQGNLGQKSTDDEAATVLLEKIKKDKGVVGSFQKINGPVPLPARWEWALISDVSIKVQYGFNASAKDVGEAQMVRITDIQNNKVDWANVPFCSINKIELERYRLNKNDLLIARTGGTIGKSFQVDPASRFWV